MIPASQPPMNPSSQMLGQLGGAARGGPNIAAILAQLAALHGGGAAGQAPDNFAETLHGLGADQSAARLWESRHPGAVGSPGAPGSGHVPAWVIQAQSQAIGNATPPGSSPGRLPVPGDVQHGFKRPFPQPTPRAPGDLSGPGGAIQRLQHAGQPDYSAIVERLRSLAVNPDHIELLKHILRQHLSPGGPGTHTPGPDFGY